jgi:hypothetical protein
MTTKPSLATLLLAAPLVLAMGAGPAQAAPQSKPSPQRQCFYAADVSGFTPAGDGTVYVRAVKDVYAFKLFGPCPDINWTLRLGLVSRGSDFICSGLDAELIVPSQIGRQRCPVQDIHKLSPAEVAALPRKLRP